MIEKHIFLEYVVALRQLKMAATSRSDTWTFCYSILLTSPMNKAEEYPSISLLGIHCPFFELTSLELRTQSQTMCKTLPPVTHS